MRGDRQARMAIALGAALVLALGIAGFALGRSLRTSKAQAREAQSLSMARTFDLAFRSAYGAGVRNGFAHGLPEGKTLGTERGSARGHRHGERLKKRRLRRQAARRRARLLRARTPATPVAEQEAGGRRRRPHRIQPHRPRRPAHEPRPERESLAGEGREGAEERALERGEGEREPVR
jgi:hypothetical protein